jgi:hypothetical protein
MLGKHLRTTNINFLHADFSIFSLNEYFKLLTTNSYEKLTPTAIS